MTVIDKSRNDLETLDLGVEGMTCASCVAHVERAIAAVPGVDASLLDHGNRVFGTKNITVTQHGHIGNSFAQIGDSVPISLTRVVLFHGSTVQSDGSYTCIAGNLC